MYKLLLILLLAITLFTGCELGFDSGNLEFEDITGTWTGITRDSIFYEGSYLEAQLPARIWIRYPDTTNSRINDIIFDDYQIEQELGEVLHLTVTETRNNNEYTTYDGLIVYDISHAGSDTMGLASMMYFKYDDIATGNLLYLGVSKFDSRDSIDITFWNMNMRDAFPNPGERPYLDYYEYLK